MNLFSWFVLVLFPLVFIMDTRVEASHSVGLLRGFVNRRLFGNYYVILGRFLSKDVMNMLPLPQVLQGLLTYDDKASETETALVAILDDNSTLILGDALIDREGEVFFFLSPTKDDKITSTLMRASTANVEPNHEIRNFTLISRFDNESVWYMDYSNDPEISDIFKVYHLYADYLLLGSTRHSMVFVAPSTSTEEYLRGPFQEKLRRKREQEDRKSKAEKKKFLATMGVDRSGSFSPSILSPIVRKVKERPTAKLLDPDFLESPDSVAYGAHLRERISSIEALFGQLEESTHYRVKFIFEELVPMLLKGKLLLGDAMVLVKTAEKVFQRERTVEYISVRPGELITVVGDIHGQFLDLLRIFKYCGWPNEGKKFLFNGDIVDRGRESIECLLLLYALKITFPKSVFINRGNHETEMCEPGTFHSDSYSFDPSGRFYRACQEGFFSLPLAHVINKRIYVVHGGVRENYSIKEISKMNRYEPDDFLRSFIIASMWDDPSEQVGLRPNYSRGSCSFLFGPDVTESFLRANGFDLLIRSHTYVSGGIKVSQEGKCWTLFSAPNYGNSGLNNTAAVVTFDSNLVPEFGKLEPRRSNISAEY